MARIAEIEVVTAGGGVTRIIDVTQAGIANLTRKPDVLYFPNTKDQLSFDIESNTSWTVSRGATATWLGVSRSTTGDGSVSVTGSNNATIYVTAQPNTTAEMRGTSIVISGSGITSTYVTVAQAAGSAHLTVSTNTMSFDAPDSDEFLIDSNTSWEVISSQPWLTVSPAKGSNNGKVTVTATSANTGTSDRTADITVKGAGGLETIVVTQAPTGSFLFWTLTLSPPPVQPVMVTLIDISLNSVSKVIIQSDTSPTDCTDAQFKNLPYGSYDYEVTTTDPDLAAYLAINPISGTLILGTDCDIIELP